MNNYQPPTFIQRQIENTITNGLRYGQLRSDSHSNNTKVALNAHLAKLESNAHPEDHELKDTYNMLISVANPHDKGLKSLTEMPRSHEPTWQGRNHYIPPSDIFSLNSFPINTSLFEKYGLHKPSLDLIKRPMTLSSEIPSPLAPFHPLKEEKKSYHPDLERDLEVLNTYLKESGYIKSIPLKKQKIKPIIINTPIKYSPEQLRQRIENTVTNGLGFQKLRLDEYEDSTQKALNAHIIQLESNAHPKDQQLRSLYLSSALEANPNHKGLESLVEMDRRKDAKDYAITHPRNPFTGYHDIEIMPPACFSFQLSNISSFGVHVPLPADSEDGKCILKYMRIPTTDISEYQSNSSLDQLLRSINTYTLEKEKKPDQLSILQKKLIQ